MVQVHPLGPIIGGTMSIINFYVIQSSINPHFGAKIYPLNIHHMGSGYYLMETHSGKAHSPEEMRVMAGDEIVEELLAECRALHAVTEHGAPTADGHINGLLDQMKRVMK